MCLNELVTLGVCPDEAQSSSGFSLLQADGMTVNNLANIASDSGGIELAMAKKALSILEVKNDMIAALHANKVVTTIINKTYDAANFIIDQNNGLYAGYRGVTLHRVPQRGTLRKLKINAVECYPLSDGVITLKIDDGLNVYSYPGIAVTGGMVNVIDKDMITNFPFVVRDAATEVKVLIEQSSITFCKSNIICLKGCSGNAPNDCGWVDGYNGIEAVKSEGFGVNIKFNCECDYADILCNMPKTLTGELVWLKWQINVFKEQLMSNRFNNWVVYNEQNFKELVLPELENRYNTKWNAIMGGLYDILKQYNDMCLNCRGVRWVVNL